jgi:hypothetical protein
MTTETKSNSVKRPPGRQRILTDAKAFEILEARRFAFFDVRSAPEFARRLVEEGITPRELHPHTICKLFSGKLMPDLRDLNTGDPYNFASVLRFPLGRPAGSKKVTDGPKLSRGREQLRQALFKQAEDYIRKVLGVKAADLRFEARRDIDDLKQEVQALRTKVERLEIALDAKIQLKKIEPGSPG